MQVELCATKHFGKNEEYAKGNKKQNRFCRSLTRKCLPCTAQHEVLHLCWSFSQPSYPAFPLPGHNHLLSQSHIYHSKLFPCSVRWHMSLRLVPQPPLLQPARIFRSWAYVSAAAPNFLWPSLLLAAESVASVVSRGHYALSSQVVVEHWEHR